MFITKIEDNLLQIAKKHGPAFKAGGDINKKMGQFVYKDIEKYVPRDTGKLSSSSTIIDTGSYTSINWQTNYAQYAYEGVNRLKPISGKRGPKWIDRYKHEREVNVKNAVKAFVQEELDKGV